MHKHKTLLLVAALAAAMVFCFFQLRFEGVQDKQIGVGPLSPASTKEPVAQSPLIEPAQNSSDVRAQAKGNLSTTSPEPLQELLEQSPVLRVTIRTEQGAPTPKKVGISLVPTDHSYPVSIEDADVVDSCVEIFNSPEAGLMGSPKLCELHVSAVGYSTKGNPEIMINWEGDLPAEITIKLYSTQEIPVVVIDPITCKPANRSKARVWGKSKGFKSFYYGSSDAPLEITLEPGIDESGLVRFGAPRRTPIVMRISDLIALPVDKLGHRTVELPKGSTVIGQVVRADGLPLSKEYVVNRSMRPKILGSPIGDLGIKFDAGTCSSVRPDGSFKVSNLPEGLAWLSLQCTEDDQSQIVVLPFQIEIAPQSIGPVTIEIPQEEIISVEFKWEHLPPKEGVRYAQWVEIYAMDNDEDHPYASAPKQRRILARAHPVVGERSKISIPASEVLKDKYLLLTIGITPNARIERLLSIEGHRPVLDYTFSIDEYVEQGIPMLGSGTPPSTAEVASARMKGSKVILKAR